MPVPPTRPVPLRGRVFRGSTVVRQGLLTPKQLRSSAWVRLRQDVYADASLPVTHRLLVSAVGLVLPEGAGFAGRSAAVLWGVPDLAGPGDPVEVVLPAGRRWNAGPGVRVRELLPGQRLVPRGRWRCLSPAGTAADLVRFGDRDEAVGLLDRLVREGLTSLAHVRAAVAALPPCRGSAQARWVASAADGLAESPQETRVRLLLRRAGLLPPVAQFRVFDDAGFVARVDFAYPDLRLAIEYDGLWHADRTAFLSDRRQHNRLTAAGWVVLHVTVEDLNRPERLVARLRALIAARLGTANTR
ncbi:endonuclease domain-containing protein [Geodermatophilus sp. CPCC 206100]|uniref:endonuclease domain-containing protein n=1 Tax=Geodermatophilus sp. CPCC 206100 TaxID=3020054 RepID=UPI003AFFE689